MKKKVERTYPEILRDLRMAEKFVDAWDYARWISELRGDEKRARQCGRAAEGWQAFLEECEEALRS